MTDRVFYNYIEGFNQKRRDDMSSIRMAYHAGKEDWIDFLNSDESKEIKKGIKKRNKKAFGEPLSTEDVLKLKAEIKQWKGREKLDKWLKK